MSGHNLSTGFSVRDSFVIFKTLFWLPIHKCGKRCKTDVKLQSMNEMKLSSALLNRRISDDLEQP